MAQDREGAPSKAAAETESFGDGAGAGLLLTSSYVKGVPVDIRRAATAALRVIYTKGGEATARFRVWLAKGDAAPAAGSASWTEMDELGAASSGLREWFPGEVKLTPATFAAVHTGTVPISCSQWDWVRIDAEHVGGAAPGTLYVGVIPGWGI